MRQTNFKIHILLIATCFLTSIILHEINKSYIRNLNPDNITKKSFSLVHNATIFSTDNNWYLNQIKNWKATGEFTMDAENPELTVRRTPGYPLFYGIHYLVFGEKMAHRIIFYSQTLIFAISTLCMFHLSLLLTNDKLASLTCSFLYATSPFLISYTNYTITEGIFPALIVFTTYFFFRALKHGQLSDNGLFGLFFAITVLVRPLTGILGLAYLILILSKHKSFRSLVQKKNLVIVACFILPLGAWTIRNYIKTNEIIPLEKFYYGAPMDYGKAHCAFRAWVNTWGNSGNLYTEDLGTKLKVRAMQNASPEKDIKDFLSKVPAHVKSFHGEDKIKHGMNMLYLVYVDRLEAKKTNPSAGREILFQLPMEDKAETYFNDMERSAIQNNLVNYYIIAPLKNYINSIFQSNTHNMAMLNPEGRNFNILQIIVKAFCYVLNILLLIAPISLFFIRKNIELKIFIGVIYISFTIFLVAILRHVELRYWLTILPLLYIPLGLGLSMAIKKINSLLNDLSQSAY